MLHLLTSDLLGYIISFLWVREWISIARTNRKLYRAITTNTINHLIWKSLSVAVAIPISIEIPDYRTIDQSDAETYFGLAYNKNWIDATPTDCYAGKIIGRSIEVVNLIHLTCSAYEKCLRQELGITEPVVPYIDHLPNKYEKLSNYDAIGLEVCYSLIAERYNSEKKYVFVAQNLTFNYVDSEIIELWDQRYLNALTRRLAAGNYTELEGIAELYT